jgi:hypothetical protein
MGITSSPQIPKPMPGKRTQEFMLVTQTWLKLMNCQLFRLLVCLSVFCMLRIEMEITLPYGGSYLTEKPKAISPGVGGVSAKPQFSITILLFNMCYEDHTLWISPEKRYLYIFHLRNIYIWVPLGYDSFVEEKNLFYIYVTTWITISQISVF